MKELRTVIDTNILVSILKGSRGLSSIYAAFKTGKFKLVINDQLLREFSAVLYRPHLRINPSDIKELFRLIKLKAIRVKSHPVSVTACRDPKDNFLLQLAAETEADFIVTGDKDLLVLTSFTGISIITPRQFVILLNKS